MSREFGEYYGQGYFHTKIDNAHSDACSGDTTGAKLMAALLEPMVNMAYAVASQEAGDSGESHVVESFYEARKKLRSALIAIEHYTEPAEDLAANAIAAVIKCEPQPQTQDHVLQIRVSRSNGDSIYNGPLDKAITKIAAQHTKKYGWSVTSISGSSQDNFTVYTLVNKYNHPLEDERLRSENRELRSKLAFYEATKEPTP